MKKDNQKYVVVLLSVIAGLFFAFFIGRNKVKPNTSRVFVNTSFESAGEYRIIGFDFESDSANIHQDAQLPADHVLFTSVNFPPSNEVRNLAITYPIKDELRVYGLTVSCGAFTKVFGPQDLLEKFVLDVGQASVVDDYLLVQIGGGAPLAHLKMKEKFQIKVSRFNWMLGLKYFLLTCLVSLIILSRFKSGTVGLVLAWFFGIAVSICFVYLITRINVDEENFVIEIGAKETAYENQVFEIFRSSEATFSVNEMVRAQVDSLKEGVVFHLPPGKQRHYRIDFPPNERVVVDYLKIDKGLFTSTYSGEEICSYFKLRNNLKMHVDELGRLVIDSGADPYIVSADEGFQHDLEWSLKNKRNHYVFFSLGFYVLSIFIFSLNGFGPGSLFAIAFIGFLSVPGFLLSIREEAARLESEKRSAYSFPSDVQGFADLINQTQLYLNDQFGGREYFITKWNILQLRVFNQTGAKSPILVGRDGWFFYTADGTKELYEQKEKYTPEQLDKMGRVLQERKDWLELYGIKYYLVIPPLKHTVYPDKYATNVRKYPGPSKMEQIINHVETNTDVPVLDLTPVLIEAREKDSLEVYYKVDSHWNLLGGFYGYQEIMKMLRNDYPDIGESLEFDDIQWVRSESYEGDLAMLSAIGDEYPRQEIIPSLDGGFKAEYVTSVHYPTYSSPHDAITKVTSDSTRLKVVVIRDSFSNYIMPYFSEHFSRSVYLWTPLFDAGSVKQEQPNIVISEMMERMLVDLQFDNPELVTRELEEARKASIAN